MSLQSFVAAGFARLTAAINAVDAKTGGGGGGVNGYPVWAEENGSLAANSYEWSWGNGATGADIGYPLMKPSSLTHMSFNADTFFPGGSVQINARKAETPGSGTVVANPTFTANNQVIAIDPPILFNPGDALVVQTGSTSGTHTDARVFFYFED